MGRKAAEERLSLSLADGTQVEVIVRRDARLKKAGRWVRTPEGGVLLRVPPRTTRANVQHMLEQVAGQLARQKSTAARRTDADLQARAQALNRRYFGGAVHWEAIRWVGNMQRRLGSCTNGGPTDGHIRISDKIKDWPEWVIDYVICHELNHRRHPDHSPAFWDSLAQAYPLTERARGFIAGVGFAQGTDYQEDGEPG